MLKPINKILSLVLVVSMLLTTAMPAMAEEITDSLSVDASDITLTKSDVAQEAEILFYMKENVEIGSYCVYIESEDTSGAISLGTPVQKDGIENFDYIAEDYMIEACNDDAGTYASFDSSLSGYVLFGLPITIAASATGTFKVNFNVDYVADYTDEEEYKIATNPVTATITISEPVDENNPKFEVYYQIDGTNYPDSDGDGFHEVEPGATVDVGVYVKADSAQTMQAFDIYPKWDAPLTYSDVVGETGVTVVKTEMIKANPHFTTNLTDDATAATNKQITTAGVKIATLKLTLNEPAVHSQQYKIYFSDAFATNLAREKDAESVNVTYDTKGVMGVETLMTYTVTYDANGGEFAANAVTSQNKLHNVSLTLNPSEPTRTGFDFKGWSTVDGEENSVNVGTTYGDNADEIFYAVWEKNAVTVTFHANNGTGATATQEVPYNTETALTGNNFTRTGHGFSKWTTNADGSGAVYADGANVTITEALDLYAQWTPNKYTVIWKVQDGNTVLETDDKTAVYGTAPSYDGENPVKDDTAEFDYEFVGWATEPNQTSGTEEDKLPAVSGDTTYYAAFSETRRSYTVTFNMDGKADNQEQSVTYGEKVAKPETDPTNEHYTFINWYEDENCTIEYKFDEKTITGPTTIYAKWEAKTYYVTFESNGGTDSMAQQGIKYGDSDNLTPNAFKAPEGMEFLNWKDADGNTYGDGESITLTGNITLTAQWGAAEYKVNIAEGIEHGSVTANPSAANMNAEITLTITPGEGYELDKLTVTDAKSDPVNVSDDYKFTMPGSDVTVTATFKLATYTVTVDSANIQNGKVTATPTSGNMNAEISLTAEPATGYKLTGYTVTKADNTTFNVGTDGKFNLPASNVTVTATFKPITYTVEFNANGGSSTMNSMENVAYNTIDKLSKNVFEKTGYEFLGWSTTEDGEVAYADEASAAALTTTDDATVTLYAVWKAATYNVTLDHNYVGSADDSIKVTYNETYSNLTNPTREGYDFDGWRVSTAENADKVDQTTKVTTANDHTLYAKWTAKTYKVTLDANKGTINSGNVTEYTYGVGATLPTDVTKTGYTFGGWKDTDGNVATSIADNATGEKTFTAQWTLDTYTVTLIPAGGTVSDNSWTLGTDGNYTKSYTIESGITLPAATKDMYTFGGWNLNAEAGSWKTGNPYDAKEYKDSRWGNVALTAVYRPAASFEVEEYKYAHTGDYLLTVADNLNTDAENLTKTYKFDGQPMYWTDAATYKVGSADIGTFFLLIGADYLDVTKDESGDVTSVALKAEAYDKLKSEASAPSTIDYDGDINTDGKVNIADANAVYQMVQSGGGYYGESQLSDEERLKADMSKDKAEKHASLTDVNEIVKLINTAANATTNP